MKTSLTSKCPGHLFLLPAALSLFLTSQPLAEAQIASDNASNYGGGWTSGSNGGSGFGEWVLSSEGGTGFAGSFIGDPASGGISGMPAQSFALYANPDGSGALSKAQRTLSAPLQVGETFSFDWGLNWDSLGTGTKGFALFSGGLAGDELINIDMGGSAAITIDGGAGVTAMFNNYGTQAMTLSLALTDATSLRVFGIGRDGTEVFDQTFTVAGAPDAFAFYATNLQSGDQRQPYFNNLQVIPEPSTYAALLGLGILGVVVLRRRLQRVQS